jgi:uncharacterized protein (DUF1800 family)
MAGWVRTLKWLTLGAAVAVLVGCVFDSVEAGDKPESRQQAHRFLTQASFGPDQASIDRLMAVGYDAWIEEQFALAPAFTYKDFYRQREAALRAEHPNVAGLKANSDQVLEAFYTRALTDPGQLRARLVFALTEIFVVSFNNETLGSRATEMVAGYMDMLEGHLNGNYRDLLEAVSTNPAMGEYLTFRGNIKEDPTVSRYPDENYAREVMQLFSIGLYELNSDGSLRLNDQGKPTETYTSDDVRGLAKVFTGWGNYRGPSFAGQGDDACLAWAASCRDPEGYFRPMVPYPDFHSTSEKRFLGVTLPEQDKPDPQGDLNAALDRLATHPNTAPFFSRQLIQRLVTSNPSPEYVGRVADRFTHSGGNLKEVVKAILMDKEARSDVALFDANAGKLREPILRMTAILRAFKFNTPTQAVSSLPTDASGSVRPAFVSIGQTGDPATSFGQSPLFSPSVFNFFRPGYSPAQSLTASKGMVAPELQLVSESSVTGYVNGLQDMLVNGIGPSWVIDMDGQCGAFTQEVQQYIASLDASIAANKALQNASANCKIEGLTQRGVTLNFTAQRALAGDVKALVQHVADKLTGGVLSSSLRTTMTETLSGMAVPTLQANQSNADSVNSALDQRVRAAILLVAVSPEFLITK